jgi:hypothetical protein
MVRTDAAKDGARRGKWIERVLERATSAAFGRPWLTLATAVLIAGACLGLAATRMGFHTSRLDLLDPDAGYNRLWIEYIEEFGEEDDVVVVVSGAGRDEVVPVLDELSAALAREEELFHAVLHAVDLSRIRSKGLHYLDEPELTAIESSVREVSPILRGNWSMLNVGTMTSALAGRLSQSTAPSDREATALALERWTAAIAASLSPVGSYQSPWPDMPGSLAMLNDIRSEYLLANDGRLGFVMLRLGGQNERPRSVAELRRLIADAAARHPNARIGLTGLPVIEHDEMQVSQNDMIWTSLASLAGVVLLFMAGFGGLRHPLLATGVVAIAMAWSFGYLTLAVGHLNILSISFTVMLIGLGIDFGIHYASRYLELRESGWGLSSAVRGVARAIGPGIITGAVTSAAAFFAAGFTSFKGVAELGVIAGGGIMLCLAAALLLMPALLALCDRRLAVSALPKPLDTAAWVRPFHSRPRILLAAVLGVTLLCAAGLGRMWYDHNLLNMQPEGLASVELEKRLLHETDQSVWFALSISDSRQELLARKAKFLELKSVERTEEIVSLLPEDSPTRRQAIDRIRQLVATLPERPPLVPVDSPEELGATLAAVEEMLAVQGTSVKSLRSIDLARQALRRMPLAECYERLSVFQQRSAGELLSRLLGLRSISNPEPPQLSDLPQSLVTRFVGQQGKHLLKIYAQGDIWDMDSLKQFVADVRSVDPRATGNPLQTYEASWEMKRSYEQAGLYALAAIVLLLLLDFKCVKNSALAFLPLGLTVVQTFGLMGWLDVPFNPANMIVLPLILGIGIDNGVHVVHDWLGQKRPFRLSTSTSNSIVLASLTTVMGFGSLMLAHHRGLVSLGRVMALGVGLCLFNSWVVLPAVLGLLARIRSLAKPADQQVDSEAPPPAQRPRRRMDAIEAVLGPSHPRAPSAATLPRAE